MIEERRGPRKHYFDCGVPIPECLAALVPHSGPASKDYKAHASYDAALSCAKRYAAMRTSEGDGIYLASKPMMVKGGKGGRAMIPGIR